MTTAEYLKADGKPVAATRGGGAAAWCAAGAIVLGHGLQISGDGSYNAQALWWIAAGIVLAWAGFLSGRRGIVGRRIAWGVCAIGIVWQIVQLHGRSPFKDFSPPWEFNGIALPLLGVAAVGAILFSGRLRNAAAAALVGIYFVTGACLLHIAPIPRIDVYEVNKAACSALAAGRNPYAVDFPDIYVDHPEWEKAFYAPGLIHNGRIDLGYPYMPLSLFVAFAGHVIGGDFRYGNLAALAGAGLLLAFSQPGVLAAAGACLLLLTPRGFFVIQYGWAEPAVVLCLAGVVFCALRRPAFLPWAVGLLLASKQHMLLAVPALVAFLPRPLEWRSAGLFFLKAVAIAVAVTLPMMVWNVHAFWHSVVQVQLDDPFRFDSLNFAAAWVKAGHAAPTMLLAFGLGAGAAAMAAWRVRPGAAGFAAAFAVIYLSFFVFSKQTFCNYYFLTLGALCCSVAAERPIVQLP